MSVSTQLDKSVAPHHHPDPAGASADAKRRRLKLQMQLGRARFNLACERKRVERLEADVARLESEIAAMGQD